MEVEWNIGTLVKMHNGSFMELGAVADPETWSVEPQWKFGGNRAGSIWPIYSTGHTQFEFWKDLAQAVQYSEEELLKFKHFSQLFALLECIPSTMNRPRTLWDLYLDITQSCSAWNAAKTIIMHLITVSTRCGDRGTLWIRVALSATFDASHLSSWSSVEPRELHDLNCHLHHTSRAGIWPGWIKFISICHLNFLPSMHSSIQNVCIVQDRYQCINLCVHFIAGHMQISGTSMELPLIWMAFYKASMEVPCSQEKPRITFFVSLQLGNKICLNQVPWNLESCQSAVNMVKYDVFQDSMEDPWKFHMFQGQVSTVAGADPGF